MRCTVLSEDSSSSAFETTVAAIVRSWEQLVGGLDLSRVDFVPAEPEARSAVRANFWRSKKPHQQRAIITLRRLIATELARDESAFVYFHYDGDSSWADRSGEVGMMFSQRMRSQVDSLLKGRGRDGEGSGSERLIEMVPFYSVESWAFQNTKKARKICEANFGCADGPLLARIEAERSHADQMLKPKERFRMGSRFNRELLEDSGYPGRKAYLAETSFHAFVRAQLEVAPLVAQLVARSYGGALLIE